MITIRIVSEAGSLLVVRDNSGEENFIELLIFFEMVDVFEWLIYWHG